MNKFLSKILLFGEYSVIFNSKALTIPYPLYSGELIFPSPSFDQGKVKESNAELKPFARYLQSVIQSGSEDGELLEKALDVDTFAFEVGEGLFFNSSIPQGYGLGSSGALCACVLDKYLKKSFDNYESFQNKVISKENLSSLKNIFQIMEAHFHGSSSGIDPLISFLEVPMIINEDGKIDQVDLSVFNQMTGDGALFLLNTKRARRTEPLVNLFLEKCKNEDFKNVLLNQLCPINNHCIDSFIRGNFSDLFTDFKKLSQLQFDHFSPMIPKLFQQYWELGLKSDHFALKLCGAGGGGFLIGFAKDLKQAKKELSGLDLKVIWNLQVN